MGTDDHLIKEKIRKLNEIKQVGLDPYEHRYEQTHKAQDLQDKFSKLKKEQKSKTKVRVAGRLMTIRRMGRASFADLQDGSGRIQLYFNEGVVGKKEYRLLKKLDMGDIIGAEGIIFKTKLGEVTIMVKKFTILTKSIRPIPEKYHGLKDVESRYRQRYVDLFVNPEVKKTFITRTKIFDAMREFLKNEGYLEVETPILQPVYGGGNAKPFTTHHNRLDMTLYMRISNEMYLKRLLVGGFEKVFEFCRDFRNEGIDTKHNPEFTIMETMTAYDNYEDSMHRVERMFEFIAKKVTGKTKVKYQGRIINLKGPFKRVKMIDAVKQVTGYDFKKVTSVEEARKIAKKLKVKITFEMGIGTIMAEICDELCEDKFIQPTILYEYPKEISALAKSNKKNPDYTDRFELIIHGMEFGNMYSELNDPQILRQNWNKEEKKSNKGDEEAQKMDEDFLRALEYGMPPASGIGIGMDRLVMLLTDSSSIRDVIFFPTLRPEN